MPGLFNIALVETIMDFSEAMEKPAVAMATSNTVYHVAMGLGFNLNAFQGYFLMLNLTRISNPIHMLFLCKFIKNNKGGRGNDTKLGIFTPKQSMSFPSNKNMVFNFSLVSFSCMVKRSPWCPCLPQQLP